MPLSRAFGANTEKNRARLLFGWSLAFLLGGVAVTTSLVSEAVDSPTTAPSTEVRAFATALATGDSRLLDSLLHEDVAHRDLASGAAMRGREAWEAFFRGAHPTADPSRGSNAEVVSNRLLTYNVAVASITLHAAPRPASSWPPHTAIVLVLERGRWYVAATRAGGNYETAAHGERVD